MPQKPDFFHDTPQYIEPIQLLERFSIAKDSGCLLLCDEGDEIEWLFCFDQGKLIYASHSIEPVDRIERHLRRLSYQVNTLSREVCNQVRLHLENSISENITRFEDYIAVNWMIEQQIISPEIASVLVKQLTQEVLEIFLALPSVIQRDWLELPNSFPIFCQLDVPTFLNYCRQRVKAWQSLKPEITSPYQRPYFFINSYAQQKLSEDQRQKLGKILKGHSFYHLAAILNQDELRVAQKLFPLIKHKSIVIREPQPPYNKLPRFYNQFMPSTNLGTSNTEINNIDEDTLTVSGITRDKLTNQIWKIVCIDDSQTMLNEITRLLGTDEFNVYTVNDSLKAMMQVLRIKPDLILLDVSMPNVDGYQLCSLFRKSAEIKKIPIIIVTGKTGLIDRARAKIAGATDYMTKPFTQEELLKMVFRYLS